MSEPSPALDPRHQLPPLILHPFADATASLKALESAKIAAQMLLPRQEPETRSEEIREKLLEGRYAEMRMLCFVGKDLLRWLSQCVDYAQRDGSLKSRGLVEQSFAEFLIHHTPPDVETKLRHWGVADYSRIFARSIAVQIQFQQPPARHILGADYLLSYYRYADYGYTCWRDAVKFPAIGPAEFTFSLYASGEYSKMLEEQWQSD